MPEDQRSSHSCNLYFDQELDTFLRFRLNSQGHRHYIVEAYNKTLDKVSSVECGNVWHYDQLPIDTLWNQKTKRIYHPSKIKAKDFKPGDDTLSDCGVRCADLVVEKSNSDLLSCKVVLNPEHLLATFRHCFNLVCGPNYLEINSEN
jgi:hypothetical protein